jgi:6-phosphogluconolactonase
MNPRLEVFDDAEAASRRGAEVIAGSARSCAAAGRRFAFAMSGGGTPWRMFAIVAEMDVPWASVDLFQVDERIAPDGDPDRSLTHIRGALLPAADAARWHPMGVTAPDPEAAADAYARELPERLDLVHLGLGIDGHTASLVPGDRVLDVRDRDVAVTGLYQGRRRITLTFPAIDRAARVMWFELGEDKREVLGRLLARDASIPGARVATEDQLVVCDRAAAGPAASGSDSA